MASQVPKTMDGAAETCHRDVVEHEFQVGVLGRQVPCVMWSPTRGTDPRVLVAMGHGGSGHKKMPYIRDRAIHFARTHGWACLAIDAPGHGDRVSAEEAEAERRKTEARLSGDPKVPSLSPEDKIRYLNDLAAQAIPEWHAALDVVQSMGAVGPEPIMGYFGVSMGSWIGIPLLASEDRFRCAVLGLVHLHPDHSELREAAQRISIPLRFVVQWDDPIRNRQYGIDLFAAFGSEQKSMHVNPGGHTAVPVAESDSWEAFFMRHLGEAAVRDEG